MASQVEAVLTQYSRCIEVSTTPQHGLYAAFIKDVYIIVNTLCVYCIVQ